MIEMSREELEKEVAEKVQDLQALTQSRDILMNRILYVRDHTQGKILPFNEWAGTHALMNSFDVFINNATRLVEDLKKVLEEKAPEAPRLRIVRNDVQ